MNISPPIFPIVLTALLAPLLQADPFPDPALWSPRVPRMAESREYFVAPDGKAAQPGTQAEPWDLASVLKGGQKVEPGSVVWLRGGRYIYPVRDSRDGGNGFAVSLSGAPDNPVHLRARPGERAIIDGGFQVQANHLWIWDLEFQIDDDWRPKAPSPQGQETRFPIPTGVLNITGGTGIKIVNCILRHNIMGIGFWKSAVSGEVHGCIIADNGFLGTDRPHGPALYTQNESGTPRLVTDNIIAGNFSLPLQLYGSQIDRMVNDFTVEGNILYAPRREARGRTYALLGGPASRNIVFRDNFSCGYDIKMGTKTGQVGEGNVIVRGGYGGPTPDKNILIPAPVETSNPIVRLRANKYDPRRANLLVSNWGLAEAVTADLGSFLKSGDSFRILAPLDFHGKPLVEGVFDGKPVSIPLPKIPWDLMSGNPREAGVFIIMRKQP